MPQRSGESLLPLREKVAAQPPDEGDKRAIARARVMRRNPTPAEQSLWYLLRDRRFSSFKFRRQVPVGRYIVDFACLAARLIIEADGGQHNESRHDEVRDTWLNAQGFTVLRFWNFDILNRKEEVSETLWHALQAQMKTPHPVRCANHPLPQGERGSPQRSNVSLLPLREKVAAQPPDEGAKTKPSEASP